MAQFIHLADERMAARIAKVGLSPHRIWDSEAKFVFAMPVLQDFMKSHQWLRELKRRGIRTLVAVQFRISDDELVEVGRYAQERLLTTAADATRIFLNHETGLGLEVLIPRRIAPKELMRIYTPTQLVGWRFKPEAKGTKPCGCAYCTRGEINSRKIREKSQY